MAAELLADGAARASAIRLAIDQTLRNAGPDDSVLFFFAGHGSADYRYILRRSFASRTFEGRLSGHLFSIHWSCPGQRLAREDHACSAQPSLRH
jgi:hypothetical protein